MLIPDTIFVSNETIVDWFFTSKDGVVLRKTPKKLKSAEIFKVLLSSPEVSKAMDILQSDKRRQVSDEYLVQKLEKEITDQNENNFIQNLMETYTNSMIT